jgi:hypothetical protein
VIKISSASVVKYFFRWTFRGPEKYSGILSFYNSDYNLSTNDPTKKIMIYQSLGVFLNPNLGCPFIPRFKYLLERYLAMSSIPDTNVASLVMRVLLLAISKILAALLLLSVCPTISQKMLAG